VGRSAQILNLENATLEEIEKSMRCSRIPEDSLRLKTISLLYRGYAKKLVCEMMNVPASTMRRWISAYNNRGIDGLVTRPRSGRPRKITQEEFDSRFVPLIESPKENGFDFMTAVRLHGHLNETLALEVSYCSVVRYIHKAGYCLKVPGKIHPDRDEEARKSFVEELREILNKPEDAEVWFSDECGVDGDPRTGRAWFRKGSKPKVQYDGCHLRQSVVGAVEPLTGAFEALAVPYTDTNVFQIFLNMLAERTKSSTKKIILVADNASWHHAASLNWHHIEPKFLPAYSPDLNPIERVWLELKNKYFTNWYTRDPDKLLDRVCDGLKFLMDTPTVISSICALHY